MGLKLLRPLALLLSLSLPAAALPDSAADSAKRLANEASAGGSNEGLGLEEWDGGIRRAEVNLGTPGGQAAPLAQTRLPPENPRFAKPPAGPVFAAEEGAAKAEAPKPEISRQAAIGTAVGMLAGAAIGFMVGGPVGAIFGAVIGMMIGAWAASENKPIFNFGTK